MKKNRKLSTCHPTIRTVTLPLGTTLLNSPSLLPTRKTMSGADRFLPPSYSRLPDGTETTLPPDADPQSPPYSPPSLEIANCPIRKMSATQFVTLLNAKGSRMKIKGNLGIPKHPHLDIGINQALKVARTQDPTHYMDSRGRLCEGYRACFPEIEQLLRIRVSPQGGEGDLRGEEEVADGPFPVEKALV
ncbi:hypothetical protein C7212DRAFT_366391 [Tuber magnatum]|uniref:Uncharacterized protein n=1 Tax=Tuber magnatum TaxID=42249 RepID=A0A317SDG1_9PEZI|nr:hypothetical protein C7212DRAFT_366391 [Tuber magnatum]